MKQQYLDFLDGYKNVTVLCRDIAADMATFYLVLSSLEGKGKPDQIQFLNEKIKHIENGIKKLTTTLQKESL